MRLMHFVEKRCRAIRVRVLGGNLLHALLVLCFLFNAVLSYAATNIVRVGVYDTKPLVFAENGKVKGLFVDVLDYIAEQEGWGLEYVYGTWAENLQRLADGEIDLVTTVAYSAERAKAYDFPEEFVILDWGVVWQRPGGSIQSIPDLSNKKIAVLKGDIYAKAIVSQLEQFQVSAQVIFKNNYYEVFKAISDKEVDAGAAGNQQDTGFLEGQSVIRTPILFSPVRLTYAVKKNKNGMLISKIDEHIARMKADKDSVLNIKSKKWLESADRGLSRGVIAWMLISFGAVVLLASFVVLLRRQVNARTKDIVLAKEKMTTLSQRLLMATDAARLGIWDLCLQENRMLWDDRMYELYGVDRSSANNTIEIWSESLHPEDRARTLAEYQSALRGESEFDTSFRILHPTTGVRYIKANGVVIRDRDGNPIRVLGINADITASKLQEAELLAAHQKLSLQFDQAPLGFIEWDSDFKVSQWNPAAERIFGYTRNEALGHHYSFIVKDDECNSMRGKMQALLAGAAFDRSSIRNVRKDGSIIDCRWYSSPLRNDLGQAFGIISLVEDITERKLAQQELEHYRHHLEQLVEARTAELTEAKRVAEAANKSKSTFLATMSHEIRTPLNAIIGMAHILRRGDLSAVQADRVGKIHIAAEHLLGLINDILDLSKIEADKVALEYVHFEIDELLANIKSIVFERVQSKGLMLEIYKDPSLRVLYGDPLRLQQALLNYVGNAIKFTDSGSVVLRVRAQEDHGDSVIVRFEVEDTGIGISQEAIGRLFAPFEQADNSTTRKYGGTGLGLAISRRIVELMGGEIGVSSTLGAGSVFWLTVRLPKKERRREMRPKLAEAEAEQLIRLRHHDKVVLLVDDEPSNLEIARIYLEEAGLVTHSASDGIEAIAKVKENAYALIMMDMQMPRMDGIEATKAIRGMVGSRMPIIAMTANAFSETRTRCFQAGMNDFISKPFKPDVLFEKVLRWLEHHEKFAEHESLPKIGMAMIDGEHFELVKQLEALVDVQIGSVQFFDYLTQFGAQLKAHFKHEESFLNSLAMPANVLHKHIDEHSRILEDYAGLHFNLMRGKLPSSPELLQILRGWIVDHVTRYDAEIKKYL
ncbi:PAS domain-containing protein [Propionivibrio dicarboxylicus]|uniref:Virulence sensor protein BvgS n=1 Tax=Propionivibrio dicarboxylicus TaxID=83767 RepID=A0A1G8HRT6_9RHOO|nr:PAS domain-containing protein [Propionivibrio dicarboxylicus]SDI09334.1 PAS domain S-box-containing protein/hemerythrin-like metal-binding domain protein [Propionivibrio dicarboxylicus]